VAEREADYLSLFIIQTYNSVPTFLIRGCYRRFQYLSNDDL